MLRNTIIRFSRSFQKDRFFSSINIFGLSVGIAVFLLIAQYYKFENSYEDFVPDLSSVYRVQLQRFAGGDMVANTSENYPAVGPALKAALPEVESFARLYYLGYKNNVVITNNTHNPPLAFKQRRFLYADSAFLPMMGYKLEFGNTTDALAKPNTAVITHQYAELYFGKEDPLNKTLHMQDDDGNQEEVTVTGVLKDVYANTHLKFDVLFSYRTLHNRTGRQPGYAMGRFEESWQRNDMYTFIRVRPGTDPRELESKLLRVIESNKPDLKTANRKELLTLQPLKEIHLTSHVAEEPELNGDERIVKFLGIIGIFVLVIAWINYVNLATAKSMERAREVGVRKVMGAQRMQLMKQFLGEAALINIFSIIISFALVGASLPAFNSLSGLTLTVEDLIQPWFLVLTVSIWIIGTLLAGFYPAVLLSAFKPITTLKGKLTKSVQGVLVRKSLVVFQFMASVALIAGTLIVYHQLHFLMTRDIGLNVDQVVVMERPGIGPHRAGFQPAYDMFRNELRKSPVVQSVTGSATIPGKQRNNREFIKRLGSSDDQLLTVRGNSMDFEFLEVFKMKLIAGRIFSSAYVKDPDSSVVISESASRLLGFKTPDDAIGQAISFPLWPFHPVVVGVVNDYHQLSLKQALEPSVFWCDPYEGEYYSVRIDGANLDQGIAHIKASWEKAFPGNPFDYFFLDDYFNAQYKNERKFGALFTTFATIALMIGCLGLLGLSAYNATVRTKEIGIRKVLGSSEPAIFLLLSKEYMALISIAVVCAVPIVYWIMSAWIDTFAYRISIDGWVFVEAGLAVLLISMVTVSIQTFRASRANPVDSLRYE